LVGITPSKFMEVISALLKKVSVEGLYHGNVGPAEAEVAISLITEALLSAPGSTGLPKKKHPSQFVIKMPRNQTHPIISVPTKDLTDSNTAVEVYFQVGPDDVRKRTLIDLIAHVLDEPFYDQLRTKEQFGYDVSCGSRWTYGVMGMCFCVVTSCKSAVSTHICNVFLIVNLHNTF
jgi:nardilysin